MDTKHRPEPAAPILIIPRQTHDEIERRQRIREALHDATAVTVEKPTRRRIDKPRVGKSPGDGWSRD